MSNKHWIIDDQVFLIHFEDWVEYLNWVNCRLSVQGSRHFVYRYILLDVRCHEAAVLVSVKCVWSLDVVCALPCRSQSFPELHKWYAHVSLPADSQWKVYQTNGTTLPHIHVQGENMELSRVCKMRLSHEQSVDGVLWEVAIRLIFHAETGSESCEVWPRVNGCPRYCGD